MKNDTFATLARQLLDQEDGALRPREKAVIERAVKRLAVSRNVNADYESTTTAGQRLADRMLPSAGRGVSLSVSAW